MTFLGALAFLFSVFIFASTPGPGTSALLARSLSQGYRSCWGMVLGMILSDVIYLLLAIFGLATAIQEWHQVFFVVQMLGGLYLIYLGVMMWRQAAASQIKAPKSQYDGFIQGFVISASNPKVVLFYLAFLPAFIDLTTLSTNDIILACVLTFLGLLFGLMLVAFSADKMKQVFASPAALTRINRVAGSIMILAGLFLLLR